MDILQRLDNVGGMLKTFEQVQGSLYLRKFESNSASLHTAFMNAADHVVARFSNLPSDSPVFDLRSSKDTDVNHHLSALAELVSAYDIQSSSYECSDSIMNLQKVVLEIAKTILKMRVNGESGAISLPSIEALKSPYNPDEALMDSSTLREKIITVLGNRSEALVRLGSLVSSVGSSEDRIRRAISYFINLEIDFDDQNERLKSCKQFRNESGGSDSFTVDPRGSLVASSLYRRHKVPVIESILESVDQTSKDLRECMDIAAGKCKNNFKMFQAINSHVAEESSAFHEFYTKSCQELVKSLLD